MEGGDVEKFGEDKRKREGDTLEIEPRKKKRIGASATEVQDEEPRAGPSSAVSPRPSARLSISGFRFHQVLGRGSYGKVVLATVRRTNTYKAVKIVHKEEDNEEELLRERRLLLATRDCPFLCHLSCTLQSEERAYYIMEYLSGGSLKSLITVSGKLNLPTIRFITAELICGLQFLHSRGIVHRDIKPDNVMLDADGHIRIIDLGLAQDGVTESGKIFGQAGTLRYMAPEMLLKKAYSVAVDWWSMGILVYNMATGDLPFFSGPHAKMVQKSITTDQPNLPPWLDENLKRLISKLLRKNPEGRLGATGNIRSHPFFGDLRWAELEQRRIVPPFKPFPHVVGSENLDCPEDTPAVHPLPDFSFLAPSWIR